LVAVVEFVVDVICDYVVHDGMIAVAIVMSSAVVEIDCDQILHLERSTFIRYTQSQTIDKSLGARKPKGLNRIGQERIGIDMIYKIYF
jgi:hypothetical protein